MGLHKRIPTPFFSLKIFRCVCGTCFQLFQNAGFEINDNESLDQAYEIKDRVLNDSIKENDNRQSINRKLIIDHGQEICLSRAIASFVIFTIIGFFVAIAFSAVIFGMKLEFGDVFEKTAYELCSIDPFCKKNNISIFGYICWLVTVIVGMAFSNQYWLKAKNKEENMEFMARLKQNTSKPDNCEIKNQNTNIIKSQDMVCSFEQLHQLREKNILTESEYFDRKKTLLLELKQKGSSESVEEFLSQFIKLLENNTLNAEEIHQIKTILLNQPNSSPTTASAQDSEKIELLIRKGIEIYKQGDLRTAINIFDDITKLFPTHPDGFFYFGAALEKSEQFEKALENYKLAEKIEKKQIHRQAIERIEGLIKKISRKNLD
jgi:tetratricopeptide (TPR) repeat protein